MEKGNKIILAIGSNEFEDNPALEEALNVGIPIDDIWIRKITDT